MSQYTIKLYKHKRLVLEETWDTQEQVDRSAEWWANEIAQSAASLIEEAVLCGEAIEQ